MKRVRVTEGDGESWDYRCDAVRADEGWLHLIGVQSLNGAPAETNVTHLIPSACVRRVEVLD